MYLRGMLKSIVILGSILICFSTYSQQDVSVKRKWQGIYGGHLPAYRLNTGNELIDVDADSITIVITSKNFQLSFGLFSYNGEYVSVIRNKKILSIEGHIEGRTLNEYFIINRKKKQIIRTGIVPQPNVLLKKLRKK